jgi:UDP-N-acetylglucosamine--N-acetylmuramyl-(pentapeptide) pyrophosphoryl-undecaprenol N-acetylglucosamine transferase
MGEKTFREKNRKGYICTKYIDKELGYLYRKADLIITRCGANTLNEEIAFEKNILGIPLKNSSSRGEQVLNAEFYKDLNLLEVYTNSMNFIDTIENLFDNEVIERRLVAFSHLKSVNANEIIYRKINELLGN